MQSILGVGSSVWQMPQVCGGSEYHFYFNESCEKPCSEWKASTWSHARAPCFFINPSVVLMSWRTKICQRIISICIDSPTFTRRNSWTYSGTGSKWEPLILQSPSWLQGFLTLMENSRHTFAQKAVSVFSERGRGRLIKSLTPRSIHFYCVVLLTSAWKGMFSMGHTHVYILLSQNCVLSDKVITAFYCFSP